MSLKSNNASKGFSLVEMAIVLVVIGVIAGLAFKGKSLIDSARIKADIQKINKISTAITTYYSKYGTLPGLDTASKQMTVKNIYNDLTKGGFLKETDFKMSSLPNTFYGLHGCKISIINGKEMWDLVELNPRDNICIFRDGKSIKEYGDKYPDTTTPAAKSAYMNSYMICQLENLLDDDNIFSGDGKFLNGGMHNGKIYNNNDKSETFTCSKYDKERFNSETISYAFRVY